MVFFFLYAQSDFSYSRAVKTSPLQKLCLLLCIIVYLLVISNANGCIYFFFVCFPELHILDSTLCVKNFAQIFLLKYIFT